MGQRQSVPPGRPKTCAAPGYVTMTERGFELGRGLSFSAQPGTNAELVVGYPGPVTRTAPATAIRSPPPTILGNSQPSFPRRPAPAPPVSLHRPTAAPLPLATTTQHAAQRPPMTTQPTSSALNFFPVAAARDRTVFNSTGISPVGSDNGSATSSSAAAVGGGEGGGMLEALQAISLSSQFSLFAGMCALLTVSLKITERPSMNYYSLILAISIAPLQIHYYSEALLTQHGYCVGSASSSPLLLRGAPDT